MTCSPDLCVVCETDGLPVDPVRFAERQAAQAVAREALEALWAAPPRPTAVLAPSEGVSARQRGRARAEAIDAMAAAGNADILMAGRPHTGFFDRHATAGWRGPAQGRVRGRRMRSDMQTRGKR